MRGIKLDGKVYDVRAIYGTLRRSFSIVEGPNAGESITGRVIRDITGTRYSYTVEIEPNPANPADYDDFYEAISAPEESHTVVFPYGQKTLSFECYVTSGSDSYNGRLAGYDRWTGMQLSFQASEPQRV